LTVPRTVDLRQPDASSGQQNGELFRVTTVLFSVSAALATLVVVLLVLLVTRRPRASNPEPRPENPVVTVVDEHAEARVEQLSEALERAQREGRRNRFLVELARSLDLDDVMSRTLEAAESLPGIDAAMIVLRQGEAGPLIATVGMTADEAARQPVSSPPDARQARAVTINYRYSASQVGRNGDLIRGGVLVPLTHGEDVIGTLAVFWRGGEREPSAEELGQLEELAASSGPAIENARRFREARQLADIDALTGLHNRRFFYETLAREIARAQRYKRRLSLLALDLDGFKAINDRIGHLAGDAVLAELGERMREVVRSADVACRIGGEEFAVILPESTMEDAEGLYDRLQRAVSSRPLGQAGTLSLSGGVAEVQEEDDPSALFERADRALYRAKQSGKGQVQRPDE
jgi:diguanylate cyclase (GGDEF)-like protein